MNTGSSTRIRYDPCNYKKELQQSVGPYNYRLYDGAYENCNRCVHTQIYKPQDLVDYESELKNITRPATLCPGLKYNPLCKKSRHSVSTFDKSNPIILAPEVCPIVKNNLPHVRDLKHDNKGRFYSY